MQHDAPQKGLKFFLVALNLIPETTRWKAQYIVRGVSQPDMYKSYLDLIPELQTYGRYKLEELESWIGEYDIGVVPHLLFENSPVALLEHFACGKKVLCSRLNGVTDFYK
ncbi:MAG: glycosyltransferase [Bacteroidales bacterium]|nr:glycosyltransferase [Bacteroidales bacterium]